MDQITSITAERLLFSHTVQMVSQEGKLDSVEAEMRASEQQASVIIQILYLWESSN